LAATRVYILAKELGVKSTSIVKKCQDEGLDVKNHMAAISAGLAATIREWFSEGEHTTTEETSQKVDLKKVRLKKKKPKPKKAAVEKVKKVKKKSKAKAAEVAGEEIQEAAKAAEVEVEPEPIVPAGPMLKKPKPAKLSGPQVVRIESLKPERRVKPRPKSRPRHDVPITEPLMQSVTEEAPSTSKKKPSKRHKPQGPAVVDRIAVSRKSKFDHRRQQRDIEERRARLSAAGGEGMRLRPVRRVTSKSYRDQSALARPTQATVSEPVIVKDLSAALAVKTSDIILKLIDQGVMATVTQSISPEVAELVALEFGTELTVERKSSLEDLIKEEFENRERNNFTARPVVATMLGHVDHGKTSLLDKIRSTQVTAGEAGGITQHIGAYQVVCGKSKITFLDTPGHAAFTTMRARGANMTDVVVLVVAADDGVMPQTVEVINHAKAAEVQVIIALNKIDLPGCDINRIYSQLAEHGLTAIEWGGETEVVKTSAITGEGIDDLLELYNGVD